MNWIHGGVLFDECGFSVARMDMAWHFEGVVCAQLVTIAY